MILIPQGEWPENVSAQHQAYKGAAEKAAQVRDYPKAISELLDAVAALRDAQPVGHRYHKGESLCNLAYVLLFAGLEKAAIKATVEAFIEDCLSRAEESERLGDELDMPAAHNLVYVFGVPGPSVAEVSLWIRLLVISGRVIGDPETLLIEEKVKDLIAVASEPSSGKRIPGIFNSAPTKRVFIGGFYGDGRLDSVLRPVRGQLQRLSYDGVLAADFAVPAGQDIDEHAISLMLSCHYAIFDFTERAGEEEFARLPDTMRARTLVVYDLGVSGAPKVSGGMTKTKMERWGIEAKPFGDLDDLARIVQDFLGDGSTATGASERALQTASMAVKSEPSGEQGESRQYLTASGIAGQSTDDNSLPTSPLPSERPS